MNKQDLVKHVATEVSLTQEQASTFVDCLTDTIRKTLKKGAAITLVGFGTFKVAKRSARMGVNPKTGAKMKIPARKVVKFVAGKSLKQSV